jgi:hypothetical protein
MRFRTVRKTPAELYRRVPMPDRYVRRDLSRCLLFCMTPSGVVSRQLGYSIPLRRPRFRLALAVFQPSPSARHFRIRLILSCALPSLQSFRVIAGPELLSGHLPWASDPSSRHQPAESTRASIPSPLRSVLDVSHVLDGFLLRLPSRVYFTPQPRPGFALQGLPLVSSRTGSSPAVALMPLPVVPAPSFTQVLQGAVLAFRALLRSPVRCSTRRVRPRTTRYPPELQPPSGFSSHTVQTTFIARSGHGLSRPSPCCPYET